MIEKRMSYEDILRCRCGHCRYVKLYQDVNRLLKLVERPCHDDRIDAVDKVIFKMLGFERQQFPTVYRFHDFTTGTCAKRIATLSWWDSPHAETALRIKLIQLGYLKERT